VPTDKQIRAKARNTKQLEKIFSANRRSKFKRKLDIGGTPARYNLIVEACEKVQSNSDEEYLKELNFN
jgi:hypothetical protein